MEDNYTMVNFVRRDEIHASGMRIFKEMFNILQHKFGDIHKDDCHWVINQEDFYKICGICKINGFDLERDIELNKSNRITINGINVSFKYDSDSIDNPLLFKIKLVYKKPILHHIYANNYLNFPLDNIPEVKKVIFNNIHIM